MKRVILWFTFIVFGLSETVCQHLSATDSGKYRINLPDYWKHGNKIWRILTDKLPLVCE